ncbi:ROK family protein [Marinifilum caeruleilacunae]|uniref:ROK family protein n=1 Tax=Marinifilum caeruleilacunae TaxID=2499076 RepID=A0ABX1WUU8_9BACT|nr:ROK family protein [Marinifilum caeruleilacunae]NOU59868.1 ROK family protein [Marinifilum caeruleilacunae]
MDTKQYAIGVDVGGSHISSKSYDLTEKILLDNSFRSIKIDHSGSKVEILNRMVELLSPALKDIERENLAGIGFAMPGPFDYVNGIALFSGENAKFVHLNEVNIRKELSERLEIEEEKIRFINDATAFAIGEYFNGGLQNTAKSLAITLGTGFGSAFLSNGIPVITEDTVPKEGCLWHLPFETGIADDYFSTRGLVNRFEAIAKQKVEGVKQIADMASTHSLAQDLFNDFGMKLAQFLSPWIRSFEVESVVIGGNISKAFPLFQNSLQDEFQKQGVQLKTGSSQLLEDAAFIGSAMLLNEEFYSSVKAQLKYM